MKKLLTLALMAAAATTAFSQEALVKEAKKLLGKGEFAQARTTLVPALTSAETEDKAEAWNLKSDIDYQEFVKISEAASKGEAADSMQLFRCAIDAWKAALECDKYDQQPDAKGKVKIKYRQELQNRFKTHGVALVQAGQYLYNKKQNAAALEAWKSYVDMGKTSVFEGVKDFPVDPFYNDIVYYTAFLAYQEKNYSDAIKYATILSQVPEQAEQAGEILLFAKKDNCKTHEDTLAFINELKELHKAHPDVQRYYNMLQEHYTRSGDMAALLAWANEEVALNAQNKTAWFLKGYALMQQEKWDDAVEAFKKCNEIDPEYTEGYFNTGVCLNSKARELQDKLADKNTGTISKVNFEKVKAVLAESKGFLEKARELDPNREKCNWAYPLWQVYYALGDTANADAMEKLNNQR